MRSITLRSGETFVIGDTAISAEHGKEPMSDAATQALLPHAASSNDATRYPATPVQEQTNQEWLAAYERELRRLAGGRGR